MPRAPSRSSVGPLVLLLHAVPNVLLGQQTRAPPEGPAGVVEVRGTVIDHETGEGVADAVVSLASAVAGLSGRGTRVSDGEGRFLFNDVPTGAYRLSVALLGYHAMVDTVDVPADGDLDLVLPLSVEPIRLEPIVVEAEREAQLEGYRGREGAGSGPFRITRDEIERRNPPRLTSLLRLVPGARVQSRSGLNDILLLRGDCVPTIVLDGITIAYVEGIDRLASPSDVESVEVYHGSELPVQYGLNTCGGVVIRTRMGQASQEGADARATGGGWRYLGLAGLVAVGLVLATIGR